MKAAFLALLVATSAFGASRPHILYILVDDLGWGDVGVYHQNARRDSGDRSLPAFATPHLDRLAEKGARFNAHYVAAPVCVSSRASFLQGVHQGHAAVRDNQFDKALDSNHTVGTVLQRAGYATAIIGKWGLQGRDDPAPNWTAHPLDRGFDYYYGYLRHVDGHEQYPKEMLYFAEKARNRGPVVVWENRTDVTEPLEKCYSTDLFTARAKKWVVEQTRARPEQPFFLFLSYATPHAALELPTERYPSGGGLTGGMQWIGEAGRAITTARGHPDSWIHPEYAEVTYDHDRNPQTPEVLWPEVYQRYATAVRRLDDAVGDLLQLLRDLRIADDTVVVFTSDNGPAAESYLPHEYRPDFFGSFGPFDGIKRDLWEGGLRTPALVQWPAGIPAGTVSETPVANWDWLATFAALAGVPPPARTDGLSLVPLMTGSGRLQSRPLYFEYAVDEPTPDYPSFEPSRRGQQRRQMQAIREGNLMAVRYDIRSAETTFHIYDVTKDPKQVHDLATPALNEHFLYIAANSRRTSAAAPRPYDQVPQHPRRTSGRSVGHGLRTKTLLGDFPWVPHETNFISSDPIPDDTKGATCQTGYLNVPRDGDYEFRLRTEYPAVIKLNRTTLIDADFNHRSEKKFSTKIRLRAGLHPVQVLRLEGNSGPPVFDLRWSGPGFPERLLNESDVHSSPN